MDEIGVGTSIKGSSDYSCASSVTDDNTYGAKATNVVARLIGLFNKMEGPARNFVAKHQKIVNKPIEKFQTKSLPPKAAKTIPITHHKLLSPIKNPGFIPTKNAIHIMEAAAIIIEPGPQAITRTKMPLVGPSSVQLKFRDFTEKAEAAHKTSRLVETLTRP